MRWLRRLLDTLRSSRLNRDLDEEIRFHVDMRTAGYAREGLQSEDARRKALHRFGSPLLARDRVRDVRLVTWLDSVRQDAQLGVRLLSRSPALALAALLSLGLAIGATTGAFAVSDALLLRPLPVPRAHELIVPQWHSTEWPKIAIWGSDDDDNNSWSFAYPMYEQFARAPNIDVAGFQNLNGAIVLVRGEASNANGTLVTGSFFRVLGASPAAGRLLTDQDDRSGSSPAVVLSHRYWQKAFGGDPAIVGRNMRVNGSDCTIVGVVSPSFFGPVPGQWSDFYVPVHAIDRLLPDMARESLLVSERFWWLQLIIRPKPGITPAQVQASLGPMFAAMVKPHITQAKQNATFGLRDGSRGYAFQQQDAVKPLLILTGLVVLVLLIACTNVANLLLARATAREREAAMRMALGASRWRLARQHLTESLVLSFISGAAALVFGRWFGAAVLGLAPERSALVLDLGISWREVAFTLAVSTVAGLLIGVAPAIRLSRSPVAGALRAGTTVRSGWRHRVALVRPLVAGQIALSLFVLVVAGLFVRTLGNLQSVPLGFNPDNVVLFNLDPSAAGYSAERKAEMTDRIAARLRQLPGVTGVTWSSFALLDNFSWNTHIQPVGEPVAKRPPCALLWTGPGFHRMLQIPLVAGRLFDDRDTRTSPNVAIVNQAFVRRYLNGGAAVGRSFTADLQPAPRTFEIVGVVRDTKYARVRQPEGAIAYFAQSQQSLPVGPVFALTVPGDPSRVAAGITRTVHDVAPDLPVTRIRTYRDQIGEQLSMERTLSLLSAAFGLVALLLAAIGLYGVLAFAVARRTAEIGIRLALGARRSEVLRLVMVDSAKVIVPGAVIGLAAALAGTRFLESLLFGLKPGDPLTLAAAVALLFGVSLTAALLPAWRAATIQPVDALRCE